MPAGLAAGVPMVQVVVLQHNPGGQSGVVAPAMTCTFNDAVSLLGTVYVKKRRDSRFIPAPVP
jgi:hypothetical protein